MWFRVVSTVRVDFVRSMSWTAPFAAYPRNRVHQWYQLRHIRRVRAGQDRRKRNSIGICEQMVFAARFPPIRWIRPGFPPPPPTARTEALSTMARDQSISSAARNLASRTSWSFYQTPACCQSRRRLQQVIPDPHPISCGSISHGMPLFSTKRMPVSAFRLSIGFRPGYRYLRGFGAGSSGSISAHNSSLSRGLAMWQLLYVKSVHMEYRPETVSSDAFC